MKVMGSHHQSRQHYLLELFFVTSDMICQSRIQNHNKFFFFLFQIRINHARVRLCKPTNQHHKFLPEPNQTCHVVLREKRIILLKQKICCYGSKQIADVVLWIRRITCCKWIRCSLHSSILPFFFPINLHPTK